MVKVNSNTKRRFDGSAMRVPTDKHRETGPILLPQLQWQAYVQELKWNSL